MELHQLKLNHFCRFCKNLLGDMTGRARGKNSVSHILHEQYPELVFDLNQEDAHQFPDQICSACYGKCNNWKYKYDKHKSKESRKPAEKREPFQSNKSLAIVPLQDLTTGLSCSDDPVCKVCSLVLPHLQLEPEIGPSPSKILRTEVPQVSPRDKVDPKVKKSNHPPTAGLVSMKLAFQKGTRLPSGEVIMGEPETVKIFTETQKNKSFEIEQCVEKDQAKLLSCKLCKRFSSSPVMSTVCNHIFCETCFTHFKSSIQSTICPGSASVECSKSVNIDQMEPLSGLLGNLHSSIHIRCPNNFCQEEVSVGDALKHIKTCKRRGSYNHSGNLHGAKNFNVNLRVGEVCETFDKMCEERKEDKMQVMFHKLVTDLKHSGNELHKDVQAIFEDYTDGVCDSGGGGDLLLTVALKSECNLPVNQYRACRRFAAQNRARLP